ncbi:preprotein translocase subunit YajC [Candidatus Fermentibacteria bacterium]|nr:preprotein translocase subunit YajC [Candidatus Fermentibacteria bacterium]
MYPWILMAGAGSAPQGSQPQPNFLIQMLPFLMIFAFFYLLIVMPKQKEQKKHAAMLQSLKKGDRVLTSGGMYGTVVGVKETTVVLKIADGSRQGETVKAEFQLASVQAVLERGKEE